MWGECKLILQYIDIKLELAVDSYFFKDGYNIGLHGNVMGFRWMTV